MNPSIKKGGGKNTFSDEEFSKKIDDIITRIDLKSAFQSIAHDIMKGSHPPPTLASFARTGPGNEPGDHGGRTRSGETFMSPQKEVLESTRFTLQTMEGVGR